MRHELVGVGLDAGRDPHAAPSGTQPVLGVQRLEAVELVEGVDDDAADAGRRGRGAARRRDLLLPCSTSRSAGTPAASATWQLAAGGHVEVHALLVGEPGHGPAQERLGGVGDAVAERGDRLAAAGPQVRLVVDEQRRAELVRPARATSHAADAEPPVGADRRGVGQQAAAAAARPRVALTSTRARDTPSRSRPMASPMRARLDQPQPRLGELGRDVLTDHVAVVVEAVERGRRARAPTS